MHGHRWKVAPRELSIPRRVLKGATCNQREREAEPVHRYPGQPPQAEVRDISHELDSWLLSEGTRGHRAGKPRGQDLAPELGPRWPRPVCDPRRPGRWLLTACPGPFRFCM